jgi:hypothetical protein
MECLSSLRLAFHTRVVTVLPNPRVGLRIAGDWVYFAGRIASVLPGLCILPCDFVFRFSPSWEAGTVLGTVCSFLSCLDSSCFLAVLPPLL